MEIISSVEALTSINAQEMLEAIGLENIRRGRALLKRMCLPAAKRFAHQIASYDERVGTSGLSDAALLILEKHIGRLEVAGSENIPARGPLLIVSNHPGMSDAMALCASLPRNDLRIVAAERAFLQALNYTSRYLIYLQPGERSGNLRKIAEHLRGGGAVLIFPGGKIEPDPAITADAAMSLEDWSRSIGLIVRLVKQVQVVPAIVSGVVCAAARRNPITRIRKEDKDRERVGAMLQALIPAYQTVSVKVAFGTPLDGEGLLEEERDTGSITKRIIAHARLLLETPRDDWRLALDLVGKSKIRSLPGRAAQ
jgi:hypothetical protein